MTLGMHQNSLTSIEFPSLGNSTLGQGLAALSHLQVQSQVLPSRLPLEWADKDYRHGVVVSSIENHVAHQIRVNREARGWSQKDLAEAIGSKQSAVSRLEDPSYGGWSISTLAKVAEAFDCSLQVRFVPFEALADTLSRTAPEDLYVRSYE